MVKCQDKIHIFFTCIKCGRFLACYVENEYSNPYKNIQGGYGVDLCTVIDETKARAYTTNAQYISTLLSCASTKEDAMQ